MPARVQMSAFKRTEKMQLMKYSPLALVVASLMSSGGQGVEYGGGARHGGRRL